MKKTTPNPIAPTQWDQPNPLLLHPGGLGLLPWLVEVPLGFAFAGAVWMGWEEARQLGRGGSSSEGPGTAFGRVTLQQGDEAFYSLVVK